MLPKIQTIDHIHLYVSDKKLAVEWYETHLGFKIVDSLAFWNANGGPLTLEDESGEIHLALFEREKFEKLTSLAFRTDGENYLLWRKQLNDKGFLKREADHQVTWSLYFEDPFGHSHEITSYDYDLVKAATE